MEFQIYKQGIKKRLSIMNVPGGDFTTRELAIMSIAWSRNNDLQQEVFEEMTRISIDESGGCSACGSVDEYSCCCDDDFFETEPPFEFECPDRREEILQSIEQQ